MKIRQAHERDVNAVRRIHRAAIREVCSADYPAEVIAAWLRGNRNGRYLRGIREHSFWIVESDGETIAFGSVDVASRKLESLFLDPAVRGRGIAGRLIGHLEKAAFEAGVRVLAVDASLTARNFYTRHGYTESGRRLSLPLGAGLTLAGIVMSKRLNGHTIGNIHEA